MFINLILKNLKMARILQKRNKNLHWLIGFVLFLWLTFCGYLSDRFFSSG